MTPREAGRITAALSHIGGILDTLPLDEYLEHQRAERDTLPLPWLDEARTPVHEATRRRLQALIAVATKGLEIVDEVHTAAAFRQQAVAIQREEAGTPGTILRFPMAERVAAELEGTPGGPA